MSLRAFAKFARFGRDLKDWTEIADVDTAGTTPASHVGSYWIGPGSLSASANYAVTYVGNTEQIDPRPLTVAANPENQLFGYPTPPLTYLVGGLGLVNGDHLTGALSTPPGANAAVGSYRITQGTLAASSDYALSYIGATLFVVSSGWPMSAELAARTYINDLMLSVGLGDFDDTTGAIYVDQSAACISEAASAPQTGTLAGVPDPGKAPAEARCAGAWARAGEQIDWWALAAGRTAMTIPSTPRSRHGVSSFSVH